MERPDQAADWRAVRAARSLYINRRNREIVERRLERATVAVTTYLALNGLTLARLGRYEVEHGEDGLRVTQLPATDARQLVLPDTRTGSSDIETLESLIDQAAGDDGVPDDMLPAVAALRRLVSNVAVPEGGDSG